GEFGLSSRDEKLWTVLLDGAGPRSARRAVDAPVGARLSVWKPPFRRGSARDPAYLAHHALGARARTGRRGGDRASRGRGRSRVSIDAGRRGARGGSSRARQVGPAVAFARASPNGAGRAGPRLGHPPAGAAGSPPGEAPPPHRGHPPARGGRGGPSPSFRPRGG